MTLLERELLTALVDAEFWQHVGQPERTDTHTVYCLAHQLYQRAATGLACTIRKPSSLNSMLPNTITPDLLKKQTRLNQQTIREAGSLTTYLKERATPEERDAYRRATPVGGKAGTAPRTIPQLRALVANGR